MRSTVAASLVAASLVASSTTAYAADEGGASDVGGWRAALSALFSLFGGDSGGVAKDGGPGQGLSDQGAAEPPAAQQVTPLPDELGNEETASDGHSVFINDGAQATQLVGAATLMRGGGGLMCTASQIAPEWVLTAKHCVEGSAGGGRRGQAVDVPAAQGSQTAANMWGNRGWSGQQRWQHPAAGTWNQGGWNRGQPGGWNRVGPPGQRRPGGGHPGQRRPGAGRPGAGQPGWPPGGGGGQAPGQPGGGGQPPGGGQAPGQPGGGGQPPGGGQAPGQPGGGGGRGGGGFSVRLGSLSKSSGGTVVKVADIILPQSGGDIALLKIDQAVSEYPMTKVADQVPAAGATVDIYGWGRTKQGGSPDQLKTASMTMSQQSNDLRQGPGLNLKRGNGLANRGDSGGPAISGGVQVGVCSGSDFQSYSLYASVADHRDWIRQTAGV